MPDNRKALEDFLRDVERRAYRMAVLALGNRDEALDIVQESMYKLVQRYAAKPEQEWPRLFFRILQSKIRDWYRRQRVRNRWFVWLKRKDSDNDDPELEMESVVASSMAGPAEMLQREENIRVVEHAIKTLPLRQQQAFMMRAWEGLSVEETAFAMGCSVGSVKTHYSRAVHSLRERLEGEI